MVYKLNNKYYVKVSGYLVEVIPFMENGNLDLKPTQNKIEITSDLVFTAVSLDIVKNEINKPKINENIDLKPKKINERTHKYKFDYKD